MDSDFSVQEDLKKSKCLNFSKYLEFNHKI
jgi:hypothetical protein